MNLTDKTKNEIIKKMKAISPAEALELFIEASGSPWMIMAAASEIREHFKGKEIILCGITNAKSGKCSEDCMFCAQSSHYKTNALSYPLKAAKQIIADAGTAAKNGAEFFGIVAGGKRLNTKKEWKEIFKAIEGIRETGLLPCASLGMIDVEKAKELKAAGLFRYHHNLETARSFFKYICTTHDYEEDIETIRAASAAGLSVCAGALIGMGESISHRIELAETLRELNVDSVPLNILNPVKGTPLSHMKGLPPMEILMTIAIFRFMLPDKDIKLCGGKERNLRQLLPLGILSGANSLMTGNYLTTAGRDSSLDHEMILDLGLNPTRIQSKCKCDAGKMKSCKTKK
ncbi:MAG: biotin synthase BioB [Deltaproteobacteria bacterium HGW-Deltaproteobacteria-13]|jgi:biotin synthase|nr:MAG: biotin synthase BioB [Deltaproteobacteria bacterium HGW-Deltaproteobacteria-13]